LKKLLLLLVCLLPTWALAGEDEDLENPGTVSAVQDRLYRMNQELTLGVGVLPIDAFYKGLTAQVGYTFHFSDSFAWQVGRALYSYDVNTGLEDQLERDFHVKPTTHEQVQWMVGSDLVWSPWYGKTSFLNRSVSHFDAFLSLGASVIKFTGGDTSSANLNQFKPAVNLGLGARLYSSRRVSYRLDLTDNVVVTKDRIFNVATVQLSLALNFGSLE
jgi:outer membrane beta-barrel protein